ncbi:ABC transporter substrate-binding protein [Tsukamurella strandjordii]|uniref:ABC transporter substrate-binding protein n=1 Tax=Tsukamurella strandjordii TaxID=147577 RepID=A0AA90NGV2_9ACTN|nr:ABC transporter substrate-binding protein [Tsukamurella strandjordii]MDP0398848.1 ABC transporter substrate-binding protein [Tsukamurella strandjordii]
MRSALPALIASSAVLAGCGAGAPSADPSTQASGHFPVTVTTCDVPSEVKAAPQRIVTMNQGATEVALALGVANRMAGTGYLDDAVAPRYQADYATIPVLAPKYPTQEKVLSVNPDLIYASYASAFTDKAGGERAKWAGRGIPTVLAPAGCQKKPERATWDLIWDEFAAAGKAFGVEEAAAKLTADQKTELNGDALKGAARGQRILWWDSKTDIPFVGAGKGSPQLLIESVGGVNVFADRPGNWADASMENVIGSNPDVIVVADSTSSPAQSRIDFARTDPAMSQLRAVRENRFVVIPFSETTSGVRLLDGARRIADGIKGLP